MALKILMFPLEEKVIERHLYSLSSVLFRNEDDAERAKVFLNTETSYKIDENYGLYTEGGVYLGHVVLADEINKKETAGLFKIAHNGKIINL